MRPGESAESYIKRAKTFQYESEGKVVVNNIAKSCPTLSVSCQSNGMVGEGRYQLPSGEFKLCKYNCTFTVQKGTIEQIESIRIKSSFTTFNNTGDGSPNLERGSNSQGCFCQEQVRTYEKATESSMFGSKGIYNISTRFNSFIPNEREHKGLYDETQNFIRRFERDWHENNNN